MAIIGEFSTQDVEKIIHSTLEYLPKRNVPVEHPQAYILGGQPGAGKTFLQDRLLKKLGENAIVINGDEYRKFIPNHESVMKFPENQYASLTQRFANQIVEGLIDKASSMSYNLIIEGTLRNQGPALSTSQLLKERGYMSELSVLAVNREVSYYSTKLRTEKLKELGAPGRTTATDNHKEAVRNLPRNVSDLYKKHAFDNITVYDRQGRCLYNFQETPEVNPGYIVQEKLYEKTPEVDQDVHKIKRDIFQIKNNRMRFPQIEP